ncbi:hypothetical protein QQ045_013219 [Rhodiola kirilowii]
MDSNGLRDDGGAGRGQGSGSSDSESDVSCLICLESVTKDDGRTVVKLKCEHIFHLDCIGSAFNAKREMVCPNCRKLEKGEWRFGTGHVHQVNSPYDYAIPEPDPVHFNAWDYFATYYGYPYPSPWNGLYVLAEAWVPGEEQNPFSSLAHPFPTLPPSPYYEGLPSGAHAVWPAFQHQYYHHCPYNAPPSNQPAQTSYEPFGPVSGSGFRPICARNPGRNFFTRPAATHVPSSTGTEIPTPTERVPIQRLEAFQIADSARNRLNTFSRSAGKGHQTSTKSPNQP